MRSKCTLLLTFSLILLATLFTSGTVLAAAVELNVPGQYASIQLALDDAVRLLGLNPGNTYSILVEPSTAHYSVPAGGLVLRSSIPLRGRETARTIIDGGGGTDAVTANGVTGVSFKNFTIVNASNGIRVTGNSAITIANNVFIGMTSAAVVLQSSTASSVTNNTFYQNVTAVSRDTDLGEAITNNIFYNSNNTPQIVQGGIAAETTITYNLFFPLVNGPKGTFFIPNVTFPNPDPLFVNAAQSDFHIFKSSPTVTSPCIDNGNTAITDSIDGTTSDIGAYGGSTQDTIPMLVSNVVASQQGANSIVVSWSPNTSYVVNDVNPSDPTKAGGYRVHYSLGQKGAPYQNHLSLASTVSTTVISGLTSTAVTPVKPVLAPLGFDNQSLVVSWPSVSGATGYKVSYLVTGTTNTHTTGFIQDIPNTIITTTLSGLVNGTDYTVWATAIAQPIYHVAVTAFDYTVVPGVFGDPGKDHESAYSTEVLIFFGTAVEGPPSDPVTGFPEAFVYTPNLPNKGCFIATAAYGYYDAPQVQALRDFRDRYLETNSAGRAFVRWYYEYGPIGAAALNEHPWLKPVARAALMPAVGGALFLTRTSTATQLLALLLLSLLIATLIRYKMSFRRGGSR